MLAAKFEAIFPHLDERQRRLLLGAEARALGHGGMRLVARAAGVREATVALRCRRPRDLERRAHVGLGRAVPVEMARGAPAFSAPDMPTTDAADLTARTPTRSPGATPWARSARATWLLSLSSSE